MSTNDNNKDPILGESSKSMKNDILFFKNEALKDFKEAQKKVNDKYKSLDFEIKEKLDSFERRVNIYEKKIIELSRLINTDKTIRDKVDKLMEFKEKADDSMLTEKIRLDNFRNDLNFHVNRIDQILKDSVIYPGIIGGTCRHKTFHDFIDYVLTQCSQNLTFREKSSIDFKSYKEKLDNSISAFNSQINKILNTTSEYTKTCVKECEDRMKSIYNVYDDRLQDARIENANYAIGLEKATDVLKKELENLYIIKNELNKKVDDGIKEIKNDNNRVIRLFAGYKKGFNLLQYKFTQLSDFIKDIRFRMNLKEEINRREFTHMSDLINFDKRKKGFMDGFYENNNYLKKGLESQLKDYISGKIKADDLFKKKDRQNPNIMSESMRRRSLSQTSKINSLSSNFNEDLKTNSSKLIRGSVSVPKGDSLESDILKKVIQIEKIKEKETIKEEDEENNSSKELNSILKKVKVDEMKYKDEKEKKKEIEKEKEKQKKKIIEDKINKNEEKSILIKIKNEDSKIQIISKDKEIDNDNNLPKPRTSLKNVIKDIFNVRSIIDNIKNQPNSNENKTNLNEKKNIVNNINKNNINNRNNKSGDNNVEHLTIYSDIRSDNKTNEKDNNNNDKENNKKNNNNNKNNTNNNNDKNNNNNNKNNQNNNEIKVIEKKENNPKLIKSSTTIDLKIKNIKEQILSKTLNIQNSKKLENKIENIKYRNNTKENNSINNNKLLPSTIKKKIINSELSKANSMIYNNGNIRTLNQYIHGIQVVNNKSNDKIKSNSTQKNNKTIFKNKQKINTNNNYKPFNGLKKEENFVIGNFVPKNDINLDEGNYLKFKKKINIK